MNPIVKRWRFTSRHGTIVWLIGAIMLASQISLPAWSQQTLYRYDALGRLTRVTTTSGNDHTETNYELDKSGNRVRVKTVAPAQVENGSFEAPHLTSYRYNAVAPNVHFASEGGIAVHGDHFNFPAPSHGRQVSFVQGGGSTQLQARNLVIGRAYRFVFAVSQRPGYPANVLKVYVDNNLAWSATPPSATAFTPVATPSFTATSDIATIRFAGTHTGYDTASGVDAVTIERLN